MESFMGNLLLTSVIGSAVVLIALAISPILKKYTKKWRYVVFLLVAIKLLLPMPFYTADNAIVIPMASQSSTATSQISSGSSKEVNINQNTDATNINNAGENNQQIANKANENTQVENVKNNTVVNNEKQPVKSNSDKTQHTENSFTSFITNIDMDVVYTVLFGVWCAGVVSFGFYYILMYFYHRKNLNRWSTNVTDENMLNILAEEKTRLGINKNIVLKKCKKINTPMTLGFRHLSIVLPYAEYNQDSIRYIFRHELTHQKRHDIYAKVLFIVSKCLHWFNPIVPIMVNRAYDDMEILCDDMVVADMQQDQRIAYNETILEIAKSKAEEVTGKNILFAFCFVEKESNLKERVKNIMIMSKRKKGYQIVALAMAIIVAGSCFVSCGTKKEETKKPAEDTNNTATVEDLYNTYMEETLIPEYGIADLSGFNSTIFMVDYSYGYDIDRQIELGGIASAYVDDMNNDGVKDMIVIRYETVEEPVYETEDLAKYYRMKIAAYTVENNEVKLLDEIYGGAHQGTDYDAETMSVASIGALDYADTRMYVDAITNGENKYILLDCEFFNWVFADGIYQYKTIYQLDGDKLVAAYAFEQSGPGSAGMGYYGYIGEERTLLYDESVSDGEEPGIYDTYEEAFDSYFADINISVDRNAEGRSIVKDESLVANILSYEWLADENKIGENRATYTQTAKCFSNVSALTDVIVDANSGEFDEGGTSEAAKEIFNKIVEDENYAHHILLAAVIMDEELDDRVNNSDDCYWMATGTALAATGYDYYLGDYEAVYTTDEENDYTYWVVDPEIVECIGSAISRTYWDSDTIPYDNEMFAEQEGYSYPYLITYDENKDKYLVRFGEHGATGFEITDYTINDDYTMTINGERLHGGAAGDPYEITVQYDPSNEIYGFNILEVVAK